jgi:cupin 2 domain-containing protein
MNAGHLRAGIPAALPDEFVTILAAGAGVRIERIVSRGHVSPPGFWYDQAEAEFVLLVEGAATLLVEDREHALRPGDWLVIDAHVRHRVTWTDPARDTVWLAVFFPAKDVHS